MASIRTLGILTSGGDCAGLNAAIRAVAHAANGQGWRTLGIFDGTLGLIEQPPRYCELAPDDTLDLPFRSGGTALGTVSGGDPFRYPMADGSFRDRSDDFAAGARSMGLDALAVIGGDGSMRILARLCEHAGLPMIGIPKTIDNDVPGTEYAIGYSSAVQVISDAIDRLQPTAASHHRVMIVEVMGRDAGHLALRGGIAGGADAILLPERGVQLPALVAHIGRLLDGPRRHAMIVAAEGIRARIERESAGAWLMREIQASAGFEARCTVLGHLQRGGVPNAQDRLLASAFGVHAVELLAAGHCNRMVAWRDGAVLSMPLAEVIGGPRLVDAGDELLKLARKLGTFVDGATMAGYGGNL